VYALIGPLLRLAVASAAARTMRVAAADLALRFAFILGAVLAAAVGLLCFTYAGLTILQRSLYAVAGLAFYLAATRRRRT
jgi:hypothetical protein